MSNDATLRNDLGAQETLAGPPETQPSTPVDPMAATQTPLTQAPLNGTEEAQTSAVQTTPASDIPHATLSRGVRTVLPEVSGDARHPNLSPRDEERYEVRRRLGSGAMGEVLLAYDKDIGREVALKRIRSGIAGPGSIARFVLEIRALGRLEHPNVLPIYDVGVDAEGELYFSMKYVRGDDLGNVQERLIAHDRLTHDRYPLARRLDVFASILMALDHAHTLGVIHRDVKPENIMVGPNGEALLLDWGVAHLSDGDFDAGLAGTPAYMAPEQAAGGAPDTRSDVYSAFVVLFELLTLQDYHEDDEDLMRMMRNVAKHEAPGVFHSAFSRAWPTPVPAQYRHFIGKGLALDPADRFTTAAEALAELDRVRSGEFHVQCPVTLIRQTQIRSVAFIERYPMTVTIVGGLAIAASLGRAVWRFF